ncbi:hypothetical protein F9U64_19055 [Gracilibacillus oryzae]|uniref:Uncharacterized protein n=1 Tax=Gracilibacillus oryzae TaxID=1672701 RepID=A0A7C8KPX4_9BACI|nr:hypothetical protein [Gracilibacillus oryzae]KAB8126920.1 hypothetical protein F9U64_19055 [Gracilibacillus oryzae]
MNKYQVTERMKMLKKLINSPDTNIHINGGGADIYEEINNPPTDKDGFVHKYYLQETTKGLIEVLIEKER